MREHLPPDQPQNVIANAAQLLSNLSQFVGVVMAPRQASVFRHIEFLRLSRAALPGHHRLARRRRAEPRGLHRAADYTQSQLIEATNYLNAHYAGLAIEQVRERLKGEVEQLRSEIAQLMQTAVDAGSRGHDRAGRSGDLRRAQPAGA